MLHIVEYLELRHMRQLPTAPTTIITAISIATTTAIAALTAPRVAKMIRKISTKFCQAKRKKSETNNDCPNLKQCDLIEMYHLLFGCAE